MGRSPPSSNQIGLKRGPWTHEEDHKLVSFITKHGYGSWRSLPVLAGITLPSPLTRPKDYVFVNVTFCHFQTLLTPLSGWDMHQVSSSFLV